VRAEPRSLERFPPAELRALEYVLCDIDDTLTCGGRLTASAYGALEDLDRAGLRVIPVTGRPAGWCDLIARQWPVAAVVGENGAFYFRYEPAHRRLSRCYWQDAGVRQANRVALEALGRRVLEAVPEARIASDQRYRESDLAIDWAEDVPRLESAQIERIVAIAKAAQATVKVASIHVNIWFGDFDKSRMSARLLVEAFGVDAAAARTVCAFVGDSPNDAPMFGHFAHTVGVANVRKFLAQMDHAPRYVTDRPGGDGFAEFARKLLSARRGAGSR
jgi:HAD superfamily hydrolase (TIGR01484 family)